MRGGWTKNLGTFRDSGIRCKAWCDTCGQCRMVDLAKLAAYKGDDYDLWGKRTPCKLTPGCKGLVRFFQDGNGGFFNVMRDPGAW